MRSWPRAAELTYHDIEPGQLFELERTFSYDDVLAFASLSGDYSPLHVDPRYAASTEFGSCVVHGILLASLFSQLVGMRIPGRHALYLGQDLTFRRPVRVGEMVRASSKVIGKNEATRTIVLSMEIRDRDDRVAVAGTAKVKLRDTAAGGDRVADAKPSPTKKAQGKPVAIVTGASRGLGAEIARVLGAKGFAVAVNYHVNRERAAEVVAEIERAGGAAMPIQADVRKHADITAALETITAHLGQPTVLVNSALGELEHKAFTELIWADFQRYLEYQVKAVLELCQAVYPHMKAAGRGAIINVLSQVTGGQPPARMADYVTSKYALGGLSRALASEWAEDGIRVNMVSPGLVQTELTQHIQERVFKMEAARTPLKRLATTLDVAQAVAFLATDEAAFLTGVNLFVTGGQIML
jgi:3-oxoacyl-[acyl-carrier protein] reductase